MAEIVPVVSEALEAQIRSLLPSQRGFGEDLQASNVITPVIDLTAAAQGTSVPQYQQQALAFGSQTNFRASNTTVAAVTTTGFFRIFGTSSINGGGGSNRDNYFQMSDGLSTKIIWAHELSNAATVSSTSVSFDFVVFMRSGDTLNAITNSAAGILTGSTRQLADVNGNSINPSGFLPQ